LQQVIICHSNEELVQLIDINLSKLDIDVVIQHDIENALSLLNILPTVSTILTETDAENLELIREFKEDSQEHNDLSVFLFGNKVNLQNNEYHFEPLDWEGAILKLKDILAIDIDIEKTGDLPKFISINSKYLLKLQFSCCPIYTQNNNSYDEVIGANQDFPKNFAKEIIDSGISKVFIPLKFKEEFSTLLSNQLIQRLEHSGQHKLDESFINSLGESFDILVEEIKHLGLNPATTQLTQTIVNSMATSVKQLPESKSWMTKILNSPTSGHYQTALLISTVSHELLKKLKPNADMSKQHKALTYAAFAHDFPLLEIPDAASITSETELSKSELKEHEIEIVMHHATQAAKLLSDSNKFPVSSRIIVLQHHGSERGVGFPQPVEPAVNLLAKVFIVAELFVVQLLNYKRNKQKLNTSFYTTIEERFNCKEGRIIINALKEIYTKH
jgi:response regulator RpfG family c-di-GMP phosphodiesterase